MDVYCRGCLRCHQDRVPIQLITPVTSARLSNTADVAAFMKPTPRRDFFLAKNNFSCTNQHMEDAKGILTAFSERNSRHGEFQKKRSLGHISIVG